MTRKIYLLEIFNLIIFCLCTLVISMDNNNNFTNDKSFMLRTVCTEDIDCNEDHQECDLNGLCVCMKYYELDTFSKECTCPGDGKKCIDCCNNENSECINNVCVLCEDDNCKNDSMIFATASQIAISIAMILGIMILISLLYKVCTRPHFMPSTSNRNNNSSDEFQRNTNSRISISSIQIRVLARLQNRPPRYETRHNYEYNQRLNLRNNPTVIVNTVGEAPPSYFDGVSRSREEINELPPAYSLATNYPNDHQGIINDGFNSEPQQQINSNQINKIIDENIKTTTPSSQISTTTTTTTNTVIQPPTITTTSIDTNKINHI